MRKRHQTGGLKKQRGKWLGQWWVGDKRQSVVLGLIKDMTKGQAREKVARVVAEENAKRQGDRAWKFGEFVELVYFPYYSRKWKHSTRENNVNRMTFHLVTEFGARELKSFRRDELQDLLDQKAKSLSFSVVDHLRWDMKQIFDMAEAEGQVDRNPARLLFTPKEAAKPVRRAMTMKEVQICFSVLGRRERLIAKLAVLAGMRPGEIFGLRWPQLTATYADIRQRVYRNVIDTPKTDQSLRKAALSKGLLEEIEVWRAVAVDEKGWVFPSENLTPLSKDNCWRRSMHPLLDKVGLGWANFLVMRRTHATLMKALGVDGKLVADQLGHSLDVNQNVYTQSPVESRLDMVNQLEKSLLVM
ncbi:MAG TPA: tyrosine-type recombinase/integrase [Acidobacteriaceae bacterium]|nr:tyrosine-type recombinase/integrase [Acidobacteriaceae bacterium]